MSLYGRKEYGKGKYSASTAVYAEPINVPFTMLVFDNTWQLKGMYQSGSSGVMNVSFSHAEKGCSDFSVTFDAAVNITQKDIVKFLLFGSPKSFFCGVVRGVPVLGSTAHQYTYSGYGLNDYFVRMNTESKVYAAKTIEYIVRDLLDDIICVKSPILKLNANLDFPVITVTSYTMNYVQISDALSSLADIASSGGNEYMCGVDSNGYFFFRPRDTSLKATLVVGKRGKYGIDAYAPEDTHEAKSKLFVLRNDGTYYTTLISTEDNDIYEEKLKGPDLADADLALYATGYLLKNEKNERSAKIDWGFDGSEPDFIISDGTARILSSVRPEDIAVVPDSFFGEPTFGDGIFGGYLAYRGEDIDDTLEIKEIEYSLTSGASKRTITLGTKPDRIEDAIAAINLKTTKLEISMGG